MGFKWLLVVLFFGLNIEMFFQGLSVTEVIEGYELANKKAQEILPSKCGLHYVFFVRREHFSTSF